MVTPQRKVNVVSLWQTCIGNVVKPFLTVLTVFIIFRTLLSSKVQRTTAVHMCSDHFTPASGKQELYTGCGVYISCVELHTILAKSIGKTQELLGHLVTYFFDAATLAKSVSSQESRAKDKMSWIRG